MIQNRVNDVAEILAEEFDEIDCTADKERWINYFGCLLREAKEKKFSFGWIQRKIMYDIHDEMREAVGCRSEIADEQFFLIAVKSVVLSA